MNATDQQTDNDSKPVPAKTNSALILATVFFVPKFGLCLALVESLFRDSHISQPVLFVIAYVASFLLEILITLANGLRKRSAGSEN